MRAGLAARGVVAISLMILFYALALVMAAALVVLGVAILAALPGAGARAMVLGGLAS